MDLSYKDKEAKLIAENEKLKREVLQNKTALETGHLTNSAHPKGIFDILQTHHTSIAYPSFKQA